MNVNDNAGSLTPRGALRFFASMLAPTGRLALLLIASATLNHDGPSRRPTEQCRREGMPCPSGASSGAVIYRAGIYFTIRQYLREK
ncbi:hypothetical protein DM828_28415 [Pseudomonas umsongensis]|nr:hypothetical protein [Pseudomonas sp. PSB11]NWL23212.1 hypothetical protein [Pseudomonas umsongensis]